MTLRELKIGETARIETVRGEGALRQHFLDMGVIPGAVVKLEKFAPMGDPMELQIHGYSLTLRLDDAEKIEVVKEKEKPYAKEEIREKKEERKNKGQQTGTRKEQERSGSLPYEGRPRKHREHPGLGEGGRYHDKEGEHPLAEGTMLTFALVGNQNCGKTTLFNQLTGSNQHVGNFPGVTVDKKSGPIRGRENTSVTDLPGIYSLSPYTAEEIVSRDFILQEKPKGIINIVDATNIERNLYLTMQLMELDIPMVLAVNMMDEMRGNGGSIRINEMESLLGIPVVPISAAKNEGVEELINHALHVALYQETPAGNDFCDKDEHGGSVHRCLHGIKHLVEDHAKEEEIPPRFAATKLVEGDERIRQALRLSPGEEAMVEHIVCQMEDERGLDRAAAIADMRFSFIKKLVAQTVVKPRESKERERSQKIDRILTGKYTAIPAFIGIIGFVFYLTFGLVGAWLQGWMETLIEGLGEVVLAGLIRWNVNEVLQSLIIDGIFAGVGSVISFLPLIVTLFFFLSLLEDTGYMARVAFVMDKLLRKIGLSGRSIVPMLVGFGCSVPGVMASRTLPSERDRKMTIMLIPFMSCTAKLPVYGFFANVFFPNYTGLIMVALYLLGIGVGILTALISKNTLFRGEAVPFVMELPNYRMPGAKNVIRLLWDKAKDFLHKAFTIIFLATIGIWFLQTFDMRLNMVADSQNSILALAAGKLAPIFQPLGFGDWRVSTALISGLIAKESVVSTLTILFGSTEAILLAISPLAAGALLIFCLLYTPCVAAISAVRRELGLTWALAMVFLQCGIAWLAAFVFTLAGKGISLLL